MANYCCTVRTNYFHVKDPDAFRAGMEHVRGSEDSVELWEEKDENGNIMFGFGCYGGLFGKVRDEDDEPRDADEDYDVAFNLMINFLQESVADDDAILVMEAGNEKLRYVVGDIIIITSTDCKYKSIVSCGISAARDLLCNPEWTTRTAY